MSSLERHEARYQRRKQKRIERQRKRCEDIGGIEKAFSFHDMVYYGGKCCRNVRWKQSTQNFELHLFSGTAKRRRELINRKWCPMRCSHFKLTERGKTRIIDAPHINDRQIQKVMCNNVLIPLYSPSIINENGASTVGKGLHWQFRKLEENLHRHFRMYGREGAVLLLDLKSFFPNAPLDLLYERHTRYILDDDLKYVCDFAVKSSPHTSKYRGMPLGIEQSQQEMIAMPSYIDNWAKCQVGVKMFGHYMDDYIVIHHDIDFLKDFLEKLISKFEQYGIKVNRAKCRIVPLTKPFKFCKCKFTLTATGKVLRSGNRAGMKSARRKIKLFAKECKAGKRDPKDVYQFMECQLAYYNNYNNHKRVLKLRRLCYSCLKGVKSECFDTSKYWIA